jgi:hypothetical protein
MAMTATFKIEGSMETRRLFKLLPKAAANRVITKALREGAKVLLTEARANFPVDSGTSKRAMTVRTRKKKKRNEFAFNVVFKTDQIKARSVSKGYPSGYFSPASVEYGVKGTRQKAQAPMRRAYDSRKDAVEASVSGDIRNGVRAEARKLGFS